MKVLVTEPIHPEALEKLAAHAEVVRWDSPLRDKLDDVDGIIVRVQKVTAEQIASAPKLKVIGKHGIGVDAIDVAAARAQGVEVVYTPHGNVESVAELVFALLLGVGRNLLAGVRRIQAGTATNAPADLAGLELEGRALGFIGFGKIAHRTALIGRHGFDMDIHVFDPFVTDVHCAELGVTRHGTVESLLAAADCISINVPLTPDTKHMLNAERLALCKPTAVIINTSRGGIIDEDALYTALSTGRLRAAASDVFAEEPVRASHPLFSLDNFLPSLHVGANTEEALLRVGNTVVSDVLAVLQGRQPQFPYPVR